jgi:hypothetical protein
MLIRIFCSAVMRLFRFISFSFYWALFIESAEDHVQGDMIVLSFIVSVALCVMIFSFDQQHLPLQKYKFPPTIQYLVYSLPLVHLFVILKRYLPAIVYNGTGKTARLFRWCGRQVFIIFLMQGVACSIPYFFHASSNTGSKPSLSLFASSHL